MSDKNRDYRNQHIAVIGGGVAGATAAIHFAELGFQVSVLEKGVSLVNGPPICHLHAGGNLYRELPEQQCLDLLKQSIDSVRLYPQSINRRPTFIATPKQDPSKPQDLISRLERIQAYYVELVKLDKANQVLGSPSDYYKLYSREDLEALKDAEQTNSPSNFDDWAIPVAQHVDLDALKYPVVAVQEYGWSLFRLSAVANLTLESMANVNLKLESNLLATEKLDKGWRLQFVTKQGIENLECDFLVNACGYETGTVDDYVASKRDRLIEFKAAYVTHWQQNDLQWPEVIFHGERGTPQGMAQLTPYQNGYFQLHGMTKEITLFDDGLVTTEATAESSQPQLPTALQDKITHGWPTQVLASRTERAIEHMAQFVPQFNNAEKGGKALFGAQQVPGSDIVLRAADVSFDGQDYARLEIVKGSSALLAAQKIAHQWFDIQPQADIEQLHPKTLSWSDVQVEKRAIELCDERGYPHALALRYGN